MADEKEIFMQTRRKLTPEEIGGDVQLNNSESDGNPLESIHSVRQAIAKETGKEIDPLSNAPFQIGGKPSNIPQEFLDAVRQRQAPAADNLPVAPPVRSSEEFDAFEPPPERKPARPPVTPQATQGSSDLDAALKVLESLYHWEEFEFPSKSKFYKNIPEKIHVRPMTGEEEQILASHRHVKQGKAIDMIFQRCIKEKIDTEQLLSPDRTHLLIFLRGISYTPEYDVEIKCPSCEIRYENVIQLNNLDVEVCPDDFGPDKLNGVLPVSGFKYSYRLPTGQDELEITKYRERRIKEWGSAATDDTLLYRTALLLEQVQGVTMKKELAHLLKKLPIADISHLRNEINIPPFGVDTEIDMTCPACQESFKIDLPLEANFFFPRKKNKTQA